MTRRCPRRQALSLRKNDPGWGRDGRDEIAGLGHQFEGYLPNAGAEVRVRRGCVVFRSSTRR
jgi:hypothetical protein